MTKKYSNLNLLFYLLVSAVNYATAQDSIPQFGAYNAKECQMSRYEKDTTADAVVLADVGKSYFQRRGDGFELIFERKRKVKIFNKAGLRWAEFEIPFFTGSDTPDVVYDITGTTYNCEAGKLTTAHLSEKNCYVEKINDRRSYKKFAMPDVKEGSVIEIGYKVKTVYFMFFHNWKFQDRIPVIYSEYITRTTPFYEYVYLLQGATKFDKFKQYDDPGLTNYIGTFEYKNKICEFVMRDVPAFKDESFTTTINDHIIKLNFQLARFTWVNYSKEIIATWPQLVKELRANTNFGKYLKNARSEGKKLVNKFQLTDKSQRDKAEHIYNYVKFNFKFDGHRDIFTTKKVSGFLDDKTGNCADINLFLAGALTAAGIEAYPVLLSTRDHGKIRVDYPFLDFLNYVIVLAKIDDQLVKLDAAEAFCSFGEIPSNCINGKGIILKMASSKAVEWLELNSNATANLAYTINLKIDPQQHLTIADLQLNTTGQYALESRKKYVKDPDYLKNDFINILSVDSIAAHNLQELNNPFEINFKGSQATGHVEDKLLIAPFCSLQINDNPLKQQSRSYPLDMAYKKRTSFVAVIHIPHGYKLFSKPENMAINNNLIRIIHSTEVTDEQTIKVTGQYEFKKDSYESNYYTDLKNYFNQIIDKFNEKIVLVKAN